MNLACPTSRTESEDLSVIQQSKTSSLLIEQYVPTTHLCLVEDILDNPVVGLSRVYVDDTLRRQLLC